MKTRFLPIALLLAVTLAASEPKPPKRIELPPPTPVGSFEGTWYYVDPGFGIAIFVNRDPTGLVTMRYHVRNKSGTDYETDAGGYAKYIDDAGSLVEVLFSGNVVEMNKITGRYERTVHMKKTTLHEFGDFEMYRAEKGRKLVQHYPLLTTESTDKSGRTSSSTETDVFRFFRKASDIVVDFSEIPF